MNVQLNFGKRSALGKSMPTRQFITSWNKMLICGAIVLLIGTASPFTAIVTCGFAIALAGAAALGMFCLFQIEKEFDFLRILAASAVGICSLGVLINYINSLQIDGQSWAEVLVTQEVSLRYLSLSGFLLVIYALCLTLIAKIVFHSDLFKARNLNLYYLDKIKRFGGASNFQFTALAISIFVWLAQVYALKKGLYAFKGMQVEQGVQSPVAVVIVTLVPVCNFMLGMAMAQGKRFLYFGYFWIPFGLFQIIWGLMAGRTALAMVVILILIGYQVCNPIRRLRVKVVLFIILSMLPVKILADFYQFARAGDKGTLELGRVNPLSFLQATFSDYKDQSQREKADLKLSIEENVATRGMVLSYFAQYLEYYFNKFPTPLLGIDMRNNILNCLPRIIYHDKESLVVAEGLYLEAQGFYIKDDGADSFYLDSFVDFNVLGFIIYPIVWVSGLCLVMLLGRSIGEGVAAVAFFSIITRTVIASAAEGATTGFLVILRDICIVIVIASILDVFFPMPTASGVNINRKIDVIK